MNIFIRTLLYFCFLGGIATASDLQQQQSTLYPFRSAVELQDEFLSGVAANGTVGSLGWNIVGGTTAFVASESNRPGILNRDTGAVASTIAWMRLEAIASIIDPATPNKVLFITRFNTVNNQLAARVGGLNSVASNPPADGIYFEKLNADTNWFCVTRSGGVETRTDTGVAVSTNFIALEYSRNSSGVQWKANHASVCTLHTTNIPTVFLQPAIHAINNDAVSKTYDVDYFQMQLTRLTR